MTPFLLLPLYAALFGYTLSPAKWLRAAEPRTPRLPTRTVRPGPPRHDREGPVTRTTRVGGALSPAGEPGAAGGRTGFGSPAERGRAEGKRHRPCPWRDDDAMITRTAPARAERDGRGESTKREGSDRCAS